MIDLGIQAKLYEFEFNCENYRLNKKSKKNLKKLKSQLNDIKYYIKKEEKRGNINNYDDFIKKYIELYENIIKN